MPRWVSGPSAAWPKGRNGQVPSGCPPFLHVDEVPELAKLTIMSVMEQLNEAITFAQSHEIPWPRDPAADPAHWGVHHDDPPPFNRLRGPVHPRSGVSGVIFALLELVSGNSHVTLTVR
jgi:hypothetical protein